MQRFLFIAEYPNASRPVVWPYDHPYFGSLFFGSILKIIGYPNFLNPLAKGIGDPHLIEMLYFFPRLVVGLFAVLDTFLIYKICERRYKTNVALIASILFAVMPITIILRMMLLDPIQLPFLLSSVLFAMYITSDRCRKETEGVTKKEEKFAIMLILLSGAFLGTAIFTKLPALMLIPLGSFLIYTNSGKSLKSLGLWFIPVILIPLIWPSYASYIGEFNQWLHGIIYQSHRQFVQGFTFFDSVHIIFFQLDPFIFVLGIVGLSYAAIKKDIFLLLWVIPIVLFLSVIGFVQFFHWVLVIPAFCIAAARIIIDLASKIQRFRIRGKELSQVIMIAVVSAIAVYGLINISTEVTKNSNLPYFEALAFVFQHLPYYNHNNNSDLLYVSQYYSSPLVLDNKVPLVKLGNVATLKGKETIWSTPLKQNNVNYIEDTFKVVALNKTDNHAGIVWKDGNNNKEFYVFLRPNKVSIASPGLGERQSVVPIDRQNGKEFTLKVAYLNNTIKVFLDDIPKIQIPNIAGANDHISRVGIRTFNTVAQFQPIKIGTVSPYQFQNKTISLVSSKILSYKNNLTLVSNPRYFWIPEYIFNRGYEYHTIFGVVPNHIGKAVIIEDGTVWVAIRHGSTTTLQQLKTFYNNTYPISPILNGGIGYPGTFSIRAN